MDQDNIANFLNCLESYNPTVPMEVVEYISRSQGVLPADTSVPKILCIAADKFLAEILSDVREINRIRDQTPGANADSKIHMENLVTSLQKKGVKSLSVSLS